MTLSIQTRYVRYAFLAIAILLTFRTFQYFPGMPVATDLSYVLTFLLLVFVYIGWKIKTRWHFSSFELYMLAMTILIPFYAGILAWREFGQPAIYGVLAERSMILLASVLLLPLGLKRGIIKISDIEAVLVALGWLCLCSYVLMELSLNPSRFANYGNGFVQGAGTDMRFHFQLELITFAFFYYAFIGFRKKSFFHYALAAPFLIFILLGGHRSLLVSMLAAFSFLIWRWSNFERLARFIPYTIIAITLVLGLLYLGNATYMFTLYNKFADAFTVILTGQHTQDASADMRIRETLIALPYIAKHWIVGNGVISHQWHGGYEKVIGGYFYPSDIGIIGVLYMYGIFGTILFACQFLFALRYTHRISTHMPPFPLLDALKGFLLYFAINSLITGKFVHYSAISLFFVALLACIASPPVNSSMNRYTKMAIAG